VKRAVYGGIARRSGVATKQVTNGGRLPASISKSGGGDEPYESLQDAERVLVNVQVHLRIPPSFGYDLHEMAMAVDVGDAHTMLHVLHELDEQLLALPVSGKSAHSAERDEVEAAPRMQRQEGSKRNYPNALASGDP